MRRLLFTILSTALFLVMSAGASAQDVKDTTLAPSVDSSLVGKSIFNLLPNVTVRIFLILCFSMFLC